MKTGRNELCPCKSGKKYKKCCELLIELRRKTIFSAKEAFLIEQRKHANWEKNFGHIRPIIHTNFQGGKVVAVGDQVHFSRKWKTFPDFLFDYIKTVLGEDWGNAEIKKPLTEKHQIIKWYQEACLFQAAQQKEKDELYSAVPNGAFAAYLLIAYDLYILRHHKSIQNNVVKRLKLSEQFQGARYELFVAATCIKAGFDIAYENEADRLTKHTEFVATHKKTLIKISVEAKSRHREGTLGQPGNRKLDEEVRLRVGGLLNQAIAKAPKNPLVVFVDTNLPPSMSGVFQQEPPNIFTQTLDRLKKSENGKDLFSIVFFTNHPHHYGQSENPDPPRSFNCAWSQKSIYGTETFPLFFDLKDAIEKYGAVPNWFPGDIDKELKE